MVSFIGGGSGENPDMPQVTDKLYHIMLIQPTISLEMPVPSQGHYVFTVFRLLTDFVCLYTYEF